MINVFPVKEHESALRKLSNDSEFNFKITATQKSQNIMGFIFDDLHKPVRDVAVRAFAGINATLAITDYNGHLSFMGFLLI